MGNDAGKRPRVGRPPGRPRKDGSSTIKRSGGYGGGTCETRLHTSYDGFTRGQTSRNNTEPASVPKRPRGRPKGSKNKVPRPVGGLDSVGGGQRGSVGERSRDGDGGAVSAFDRSEDGDSDLDSSGWRGGASRLRRRVGRGRRQSSVELFSSADEGNSSGVDDEGGYVGGRGVRGYSSDGSYSATSSGQSSSSGRHRHGSGSAPTARRRKRAVAALQLEGDDESGAKRAMASVAERALAEAVKAETAAVFVQSGLDPPSGPDTQRTVQYSAGAKRARSSGSGRAIKITKRSFPNMSRKGKVTHCPHTDRAVYSRGQCRPCYMIAYWNRKHAELGLAPRARRSSTWGKKKRERGQALVKKRTLNGHTSGGASASSDNMGGNLSSAGEHQPSASNEGNLFRNATPAPTLDVPHLPNAPSTRSTGGMLTAAAAAVAAAAGWAVETPETLSGGRTELSPPPCQQSRNQHGQVSSGAGGGVRSTTPVRPGDDNIREGAMQQGPQGTDGSTVTSPGSVLSASDPGSPGSNGVDCVSPADHVVVVETRRGGYGVVSTGTEVLDGGAGKSTTGGGSRSLTSRSQQIEASSQEERVEERSAVGTIRVSVAKVKGSASSARVETVASVATTPSTSSSLPLPPLPSLPSPLLIPPATIPHHAERSPSVGMTTTTATSKDDAALVVSPLSIDSVEDDGTRRGEYQEDGEPSPISTVPGRVETMATAESESMGFPVYRHGESPTNSSVHAMEPSASSRQSGDVNAATQKPLEK